MGKVNRFINYTRTEGPGAETRNKSTYNFQCLNTFKLGNICYPNLSTPGTLPSLSLSKSDVKKYVITRVISVKNFLLTVGLIVIL